MKLLPKIIIEYFNHRVRVCFQAIVIYMPPHKCFVVIFFLSGPKAIF